MREKSLRNLCLLCLSYLCIYIKGSAANASDARERDERAAIAIDAQSDDRERENIASQIRFRGKTKRAHTLSIHEEKSARARAANS